MAKALGAAMLGLFLQSDYAQAKPEYKDWLSSRLGLKMKPWYPEPEADHASDEWLMWVLSTTAPSFIGKYATLLGPGGKKVLKKGTNGWACLPCNAKGMPKEGFKDANDALPLCGDPMTFKWITAYIEGKKPDMEADGWAWMLHGDLGEDNREGGHSDNLAWRDEHKDHWIQSGPHLMMVPRNLEALTTESDFGTGAPYTMFAGTDYAHVMIPMEGYYRYEKQIKITEAAESAEATADAEAYAKEEENDGLAGHAQEKYTAFGHSLIENNAPTKMGGAVMALACLASMSLGILITRRVTRSSIAVGEADEESQ